MKDILTHLCQIQMAAYQNNISCTSECFFDEKEEEKTIKVTLRYNTGVHDMMDNRYYCTSISSIDKPELVTAKLESLRSVIANAEESKKNIDKIINEE